MRSLPIASLLAVSGVVVSLASLAPLSSAVAAKPEANAARPFVMPDLSGSSSVGVEMQLTTWQYDLGFIGSADVTAMTLDAVADVAVGSNLVVFGKVPVAYVSAEDSLFTQDCCGGSLGNVTAGLRLLAPERGQGGGLITLSGEASLSLPTADDDGEGGTGQALAFTAQLPHDPGRYLPNTTTLRFAGDLRYVRGRGFLQVGAGFDFLSIDDDSAADDDETQSLFRLGLAAGALPSPRVAVLAELTTLADLDSDDTANDDDDYIHALDLGVRYQDPQVSVGARLYLPLDETFRDLDMVGFGLDLAGRF